MKSIDRQKARKAKRSVSHRKRDDFVEGSIFALDILGDIILFFPRAAFYIVSAPFRLIGSLLDGF